MSITRQALPLAVVISVVTFATGRPSFAQSPAHEFGAQVEANEPAGLLPDMIGYSEQSRQGGESARVAEPAPMTFGQASYGPAVAQTVSYNTVSGLIGTEQKADSHKHACMDCGKSSCHCKCTVPVCRHRSGFFGEVLYLRPGNVDMIYAIEQTDPSDDASPTGPVGIAELDGDVGFRVGFSFALEEHTSVVGTYTWFEVGTRDQIVAMPGNVLDSQIIHPSTETTGQGSTEAAADYGLRFQLADLECRRLLWGTCQSAFNIFGGVRYAHLEQDLTAVQLVGVPTGMTNVTTDIDFDGFGIRLGFDGQRRHCRTGLMVYGTGAASFVAGEFKADYIQTSQFAGGVVANHMSDYRVVSILDLELGVGWQNDCGNFRVTAGYLTSGWFNTMTTGAYVDGVRANALDDLDETLSFNGFVARTEFRF
jgi:hypothetical protein